MPNIGSTNFNGTNGIGLSTLDANWVQAFGSTYSMEVYNNRARGSNGSNNPTYIYNIAPPSADYSVSADFYIAGTTSTAFTAWILARQSTTADTRYSARWRNGTGWQLYKYVAGTATQLGSTVAATYTAGSTHTAKLVCDGTAISVYVDNVLTIGPITDSSITAAGYGGIRVTTDSMTDGVHLDNFSIDTLATDASASGGTGTGTGSGTGGDATGGGGANASVSSATGTSTGSGSGGTATGTTVGAGTFITDAMENNTGAGLLASTAVTWTWWQGNIGATPTSLTHGSGTTNSSGILNISGLPAGAGFLLARTADATGVYYQPGTVT